MYIYIYCVCVCVFKVKYVLRHILTSALIVSTISSISSFMVGFSISVPVHPKWCCAI